MASEKALKFLHQAHLLLVRCAAGGLIVTEFCNKGHTCGEQIGMAP